MSLKQKGFAVVEGVIVIALVGVIAGAGVYVYRANQSNDIVATTKSKPTLNSEDTTEPEPKYLEFKTLGVKLALNEQTKDAYNGDTSDNEIYIGSRSVESQPGFETCKVNDSGLAALSSAKIGEDHFGSPWTEAQFKQIGAVQIDETFYWVQGAPSGCWNYQSDIEENDPKIQKYMEFRSAITKQQNTITRL